MTDQVHLRHCILYEYRKGAKVKQATKNIRSVYGEESVSLRTVHRWYDKFQKGNFSLDETARYRRVNALDIELLKNVVEENPKKTTRELAKQFNVSHMSIINHLHQKCGMIYKKGKWIPKPEEEFLKEGIPDIQKPSMQHMMGSSMQHMMEPTVQITEASLQAGAQAQKIIKKSQPNEPSCARAPDVTGEPHTRIMDPHHRIMDASVIHHHMRMMDANGRIIDPSVRVMDPHGFY